MIATFLIILGVIIAGVILFAAGKIDKKDK